MRQEEIEKVANEYCDRYNYRKHVKKNFSAPFEHFVEGALWADKHPALSPWVSVKDWLPNVGDDILIANTDGDIYHAAFIKDNYGNYGFEVLDEDFDKTAAAIFWMPIPPIPTKTTLKKI